MINLKPITLKNVDDIIALKADRKLVLHNEGSIADAFAYWVERGYPPIIYGIYNAEQPVGFVKVTYWQDDDRDNNNIPYYFLHRLMIDENHQGKGYAYDAMKLVVEEVKTLPNGSANAFFTSTHGEHATRLYEKLGFVRTYREKEGEEVELKLAL